MESKSSLTFCLRFVCFGLDWFFTKSFFFCNELWEKFWKLSKKTVQTNHLGLRPNLSKSFSSVSLTVSDHCLIAKALKCLHFSKEMHGSYTDIGKRRVFSTGGSSYLVLIPRYYKAKLPVLKTMKLAKTQSSVCLFHSNMTDTTSKLSFKQGIRP